MISDSEYLERVVAGIQAIANEGAQVSWNEKVGERQFDVVVRFEVGLLKYLVLIEVKNRKRRTPAEDVEAFVTKARDQLADKAVFVSAAGFQSGAIKVAGRHGIDLFSISFDIDQISLPQNSTMITISNIPDDLPPPVPEISLSEPHLVNCISDIRLCFSDGTRYELPNEQAELSYYMSKTIVDDRTTLDDVVKSFEQGDVSLGEARDCRHPLSSVAMVQPPDEQYFPSGDVVEIQFKSSGVMARVIEGNVRVDPNLFSPEAVYRNESTGEEFRVPLADLPLGFSQVEPGHFYLALHPLHYLYCNSVSDGQIEWYIVESFQNREILTGITRQDIKYSVYYIPATDKQVLARLAFRLKEFKSDRGL